MWGNVHGDRKCGFVSLLKGPLSLVTLVFKGIWVCDVPDVLGTDKT